MSRIYSGGISDFDVPPFLFNSDSITMIKTFPLEAQTVRSSSMPLLPLALVPALVSSILLAGCLCTGALASTAHDDEDDADGLQPRVHFSVIFKSGVDSRTWLEDTKIDCTLDTPAKCGYEVLAPAGSVVEAHVEPYEDRNGDNKKHHKFTMHDPLRIKFDRIITPDKKTVEISGEAIPQVALFTNGSTVRRIEVGLHGQIMKAEDVDVAKVPECGIYFAKKHVDPRMLFAVNLDEGDTLKVEATIPAAETLSGKLMNK